MKLRCHIIFQLIYCYILILSVCYINCDIFRSDDKKKETNTTNATEAIKDLVFKKIDFDPTHLNISEKTNLDSKNLNNTYEFTQFNNQNFLLENNSFFHNFNNSRIEDHTRIFFTPFTFKYSVKVNQCLNDYSVLKEYLQKIALTFYYSNKTDHFGNEELKHNSTHFELIKSDNNTRVVLKINISTPEGTDSNFDITTVPGSLIKSIIHTSNTTWTERLSNVARRKSSLKLMDVLKSENKGIYSIKECICTFVSETQINLGMKVSLKQDCLRKIEELVIAIKANPNAEFELTQKTLDRTPSKLIIPPNMRQKMMTSSWRDSIAESQEFVYSKILDQPERKLVSTYIKGNEVIRQLRDEVRNKTRENSDLEVSEQLIYFDSRDLNGSSCVYFPYDQGSCGGCYAFVVIASLSISNCVQKLELPAPLSPQQIIDCSQKFGNLGCDGGFYSNGWSYLLEQNVPQNSICSWKEYPYIDLQNDCKASTCSGCLNVSKYNVFTGLILNGEDGWEFVQAVLPKVGSISLSVNSNLPGFTSYSGGIYKAPKCTTFSELDHAVIMIGFGISENGEKYYVIQNSWGTSWGIGGFMNVSISSCDMFWYPGIIRQASSDPLPEMCTGNKFLLTGPSENNTPPVFSGTTKFNFFTLISITKLLLIMIFI